VFFGGQEYIAIPYKAEGFEIRNEGVLPNPTLTIGNIGLEFTSLVNSFDDLLGMTVYRRRVLARHLDSGSNPDVNARWPDETWFVQRKASESKLVVTFELSTPFDLDGLTLPKRRALRYACPWLYRGAECGYTGGPVANEKDQPTTDPAQDKCGKRVSSCKLRFGGSNDLPYGGFPGLSL
jgi:lambda family phage minor tail protein L